MNDLISRQAAIDVLEEDREMLSRVLDDTDVVGNEREKFEWGLGLIESYINDMIELPSAQPVIRCKDCKHFGGGTYCYERDDMWCEDDFCSYAERKEQDDG